MFAVPLKWPHPNLLLRTPTQSQSPHTVHGTWIHFATETDHTYMYRRAMQRHSTIGDVKHMYIQTLSIADTATKHNIPVTISTHCLLSGVTTPQHGLLDRVYRQ